MSTIASDSEVAASILKLAGEFVAPLRARGGFDDHGQKFHLEIRDGERSVLEWANIPAGRIHDPERLASTLEDLRLSLKAMGYDVGPAHLRGALAPGSRARPRSPQIERR
jgi:hypothetical protein